MVQNLNSPGQHRGASSARGELLLGDFRLDLAQGRLWHAGRQVELQPRAFDILRVLASAEGALVSKDQLMDHVWPGLVVEDNNIHVHVSALRKVLGGDAGATVQLLTVPGRGYRLLVQQARAPGPEPLRGPAVAVLPFAFLGDEPAGGYFAEGIVQDIITGLSRVRWLSVLGRHWCPPGVAGPAAMQAARELGAEYLLQGSLRRQQDLIRITASVTETAGGRQVWSDRYDRRLVDVFALQDEIASCVVGAMDPGLRQAEIQRIRRLRPQSLDAYDLVLRAWPHVFELMPAGCAPAVPLLEQALQREPRYALAHAALGWCHHVRFSRGGLLAGERAAAIRHARAAAALAGDDALPLAIGAFVLWFDAHETETAFDLFEQALAISPCNVMALATSAVTLAWSGRTEEAIARAGRALALSPFDPLRSLAHLALSGAHFQQRSFDEAQLQARRALDAAPGFSVPCAYLCAALVRLGRLDEARAVVARLLALDQEFGIARYRVTVGVVPAVFDAFASAWREAGMPE